MKLYLEHDKEINQFFEHPFNDEFIDSTFPLMKDLGDGWETFIQLRKGLLIFITNHNKYQKEKVIVKPHFDLNCLLLCFKLRGEQNTYQLFMNENKKPISIYPCSSHFFPAFPISK
ncbi:MAG: hypothetical protein OEV44_10815 [Spirochaetota bacterium]|nr:hypothetical protein [Spirochaetota bacterium]